MTDLLVGLHYDYGLLQVSLRMIDEARGKWSEQFGRLPTEEELRMPLGEDEPALMVRLKKTPNEHLREATDDDLALLGQSGASRTKNVKVMELSPEEYHFFRAFRPGIANLTSALPEFIFGMSLVHAYSLFEHYLASVLKRILVQKPVMLGRMKKVELGELLDKPTKEDLLAEKANEVVREFFYKAARDWLRVLREKYGFKRLSRSMDDRLVELNLIRNCVVHNHGVADGQLEKESRRRFNDGHPLGLNEVVVSDAVLVLRNLATDIDSIAESVHLVPMDGKEHD